MVDLKPRVDVPFCWEKRNVTQNSRKKLQHKIFVDHGLNFSGREMLTVLESIPIDEINRICFAQIHWDYPEDPYILLESGSEYRLGRGIDLCLVRLGEAQVDWKWAKDTNQDQDHHNEDVHSVGGTSEAETVSMDTDLDDDEDHQLVWVWVGLWMNDELASPV